MHSYCQDNRIRAEGFGRKLQPGSSSGYHRSDHTPTDLAQLVPTMSANGQERSLPARFSPFNTQCFNKGT